jgi:cold shock CspA family protein
MSLIGKVLWWDERDGNGIIKDADGKKYYFDTSVLDSKQRTKPSSGKIVKFALNKRIKDSLCACAVSIISVKDRASFKSEIRGLDKSTDAAA